MSFDVTKCNICPRNCGADRTTSVGFCRMPANLVVARAGLHFWEEPCISGTNGSGTVFFSGCSLRCCFCQNYEISHNCFGREITTHRLAEIFIELKDKGAHNINLVNPTHFVPKIIEALDKVKDKLDIPVVYNSGGYESVETLKSLEGYIDIYLPDMKYMSPEIAKKYSLAYDYPDVAKEAIKEMYRQTGECVIDNGIMKKGLIIRHMVLPSNYRDSIEVIDWISSTFNKDKILVSIMSQYVPYYKATEHSEINRRLTTFEYEKVTDRVSQLGLDGFFQDKNSAKEEYTPPFDLEGV